MTTAIGKIDEKQLAAINSIVKELDADDWLKVGTILVKDSSFYRIERIITRKLGGSKKELEVCAVLSDYVGDNNWEAEFDINENNKKSQYSNWDTIEVSNLNRYSYRPLIGVIDLEKYCKEVLSNVLLDEPVPEEAPVSASTEVGFRLGREHLDNLKAIAQSKLRDIQARSATLKAIMESKRNELYEIASVYKKQLSVINRTIFSIELYLGVKEEITHLVKGENAPKDAPIILRQMLLYMDEETGIWEGGGIDINSVNKFDEWIKTERNFERLIPDTKGVVGIRIRRNVTKNEYNGYDPALRAAYEAANRNWYFLIRNGENIYTIWTAISECSPPRLFPLRTEFQALIDKYKNTNWESDKDKIENEIEAYKRIFLVLKGIIERTEIFRPYPDHLYEFDIFKPETYGDYVKYIYDDELTLPDNRLRYNEWKQLLNDKIERGTRIYIGRGAPNTGAPVSYSESSYRYDRVDSSRLVSQQYLTNKEYSAPPPGLYTVEEGEEDVRHDIYEYFIEGKSNKDIPITLTKEEEEIWETKRYYLPSDVPEVPEELLMKLKKIERKKTDKFNVVREKFLYIKYNPGGDVFEGWHGYDGWHERKNKIKYRIYPTDSFVFNYDLLPFEDIDFYLESRIDRPNYLSMIPTLLDLKEFRSKELEWENHFAKLTVNEIKKELKLSDKYKLDIIIFVWESISWWKEKVIWKRPISKDDAKALRMIKQRVISRLKEMLVRKNKGL